MSSCSGKTPSEAEKTPLPPGFCENYGFTDENEFWNIFKHIGDGVFQIRDKQLFYFQHAIKTTGDRARNVFQVDGSGKPAGVLWKSLTDFSIRQSSCSAANCINEKCKPGSPEPAGATAHVYNVHQGDDNKYIPYCIFIPTCSYCNNHYQTMAHDVNWRGKKELQAYCGSKVIFVEINEATTSGKGGGKGN